MKPSTLLILWKIFATILFILSLYNIIDENWKYAAVFILSYLYVTMDTLFFYIENSKNKQLIIEDNDNTENIL